MSWHSAYMIAAWAVVIFIVLVAMVLCVANWLDIEDPEERYGDFPRDDFWKWSD